LPASRTIILLLGGARSGKSTFAQKLAGQLGNKVLFVATGEALDDEMETRIKDHKKNRPENWRTLEAPHNIGKALRKQIGDAEVIIIDCLTLLISNLLGNELHYPKAEKQVFSEINELISTMNASPVHFIIVSNEVGLGLVPDNELGRIYRDLLGKANQLIAQNANTVYFMAAGIPLKLKGMTKQ
jgi:adenosylcobinamide kinase/adenosylcobinamide-phosphate guanylyltransferase